MQIVIDIPEDVYVARKYGDISPWITGTILDAVEQGTPLPKGHGRLIDADALVEKYGSKVDFVNGRIGNEYINAPTVLEADKEI